MTNGGELNISCSLRDMDHTTDRPTILGAMSSEEPILVNEISVVSDP